MHKLLGTCGHGSLILLYSFSAKAHSYFLCKPSFSSSSCSPCVKRSGCCPPAPPALELGGIAEPHPMDHHPPLPSTDLLFKEVELALGSPLGSGRQAPPPKPLVMVISGPSGVGKDAVIKRLREVREKIHFVVTATTRPKRPGEVHGEDYIFVSKEEFESMIQKDELLEHAIVYGDYKGIPKVQVKESLAKGLDVVLRVDVQGAATIRSILGSGAVFIFVVAESEAALVKRLVARKTETKEELLLRISTARKELERMNQFDYVVVNGENQLEETVSLICHIMDAENSRVNQKEVYL